jgi:hypothetical protein
VSKNWRAAVVGFLKKLFGLEPKSVKLLRARIVTGEDYRYYISFSKYQPKLQPIELVRLILHYYAIILSNLNQSDPEKSKSALILKNMMQAVINKDIQKDSNILRNAGIDNAVKVASSEPENKPREIFATLFFIDKMKRHITTDIPRNTHAKHLIFSVMALIHSTLIYLDQECIDILNRSLSDMNEVYDSGQSFSDINNLVAIPTRAFISAMKREPSAVRSTNS